jgi:hypothetical protein
MSQFRSVGGLDEPISEDVDRGFFAVNQRLQLNQLQEGEVRESLNGRMEGYWKPRKGVVEKTAALTTGQTPLQLPFYLIDAAKTISDVTVPAAGTVRITVTAHGFAAASSGWATIAGLDASFNGSYLLTYVDVNRLSYTIAGVTTAPVDKDGTLSQMVINDVANANVRASCLFSDPNTNNKEFIIVAMDTVAKKIDLAGIEAGLGAAAITDIPYPSGQAIGTDGDMIQLFDKVMLFRDGQQALEWYPNGRSVLSASQAGSLDVIINVRDHGLSVGTSITVSGLTGGTPANGTFLVKSIVDEDSFIYEFTSSQTQVFGVDSAIATDGFTLSPAGQYTQPQIFNVNGLAITALDGLVTVSVEGNVTLKKGDIVSVYECTIPEFEVLIGTQLYIESASSTEVKFYAPVPNFTQDVVSAYQIGTTVTANVKGHAFSIGDSISVDGLTGIHAGTTPPNGTQIVTSISGDVFTYTATAALPYYTIPTSLNATAATWATGGVVTITINSHGFAGNGWAEISGFTGADSILNGNRFFTRVNSNQLSFVVTGSTSVTYQTPILSQMKYDLIATGAIAFKPSRSSLQIEVGGQFSVGGGFMHQPAAPWGVPFQRRLWVPYYYDQSGPFNAPVYTSRKITDEIAVSDILDTTTFDQIESQFRISGGTADYVVGMHGFYNDALVVLNRNSLHVIEGTLGSLLDCRVKELTSEIGCLARKSVVMRGNTMMFLSDDGVYSLEFLNDYNLRGSEEPISKNIQPYIDRINKDYADEAVGILFDNRYYLAVALDSSVGANDAQGNNSVLVYNFKNQGWESLDTYGDSRFLIKNLLTGGAGVRNDLYAVTRNGGLHQIDAVESSSDRLNVSNVGGELITTTINSSLTTRGYDLKTMERKRFTDAQILMQNLSGDTGEYNILFSTEDPDTYEQLRKSAQEIGTTTDFLGGVVLAPSTPNEAETASIRCRLAGIRGYTGTLILTRTIGSPKINSVKVAGSVTNRQIISQK